MGTIWIALFFSLASLSVCKPPPRHEGRQHLPRGPTRFDPTHLIGKYANGVLDEPPISMCEERFRNTTLDHFSWDDAGGTLKFTQRYFFCDRSWKTDSEGKRGPIFVYLGNEANVELYLNATGLMWENAPEFGALLLFIEHRYYGKTRPFGDDFRKHRRYLTTEQALADYVETLYEIKEMYSAQDSAVIGFGGSLGGMYAAWMRMKYPHILDGAVAASAPIWQFMGLDPPYIRNGYARILSRDCTPAAGAAEECQPNLKRAWDTMFSYAYTQKDRETLTRTMGFCKDVVLEAPSEVWRILEWVESALSYMSMGSFSFKSGYMIDGDGLLPAFPLRVACSYLSEPLEGLELLEAVSRAAGVYYNYSGELPCNDDRKSVNEEHEIVLSNWDYQYCTEMFQIWEKDGVTDMFWSNPWNPLQSAYGCMRRHGVVPRPFWAVQQWGGKNINKTASNIVFSNGEYDPWSAGGVLEDLNESAVAIYIAQGGHHGDLMFSHKGDSQAMIDARKREMELVRKWIEEKASTPPSESPTRDWASISGGIITT